MILSGILEKRSSLLAEENWQWVLNTQSIEDLLQLVRNNYLRKPRIMSFSHSYFCLWFMVVTYNTVFTRVYFYRWILKTGNNSYDSSLTSVPFVNLILESIRIFTMVNAIIFGICERNTSLFSELILKWQALKIKLSLITHK